MLLERCVNMHKEKLQGIFRDFFNLKAIGHIGRIEYWRIIFD